MQMGFVRKRKVGNGVEPASSGGPLPWRSVLLLFALVAVALSLLVAQMERNRGSGGLQPSEPGPLWLNGWYQGDAGWYLGIADSGYFFVPGQQSSIAFFPTYPLALRVPGNLLGDNFQLAGTLIAVVAGAAAVLLFARWVWTRLPRRSAVLAIAILLVYPYSFFLYGAMYADSLFLLCAIGAFVLVERRWYLAAGLAGALATAGRPVGIAVVVGLVVRTVEILADDRRARSEPGGTSTVVGGTIVVHSTWRELVGALRDVRVRQLGVLASLAGVVAWCIWLGVTFGHPLAWVEAESAPGWNQGVGPRTWFKIVFLGTLVKGPYDIAGLLVLQAAACLCAVLLLRRVWQRFGWGYAAYAAVVLLIPILGTKDFMGTGRYVLAAFPVMAAAGDYLAGLRHRWVCWAILGLCTAALVLLTALFGRSVEVS